MPHFLHHKRRHSWPYCGPPSHSARRHYAPVIAPQAPPPPLSYSQFAVPLVTTDLYEQDDAASAGIVRPRHSFAHRLWSTPKGHLATASASTSTASTSSMRQVVRPSLDKARSLFVLPTASTVPTTTTWGNANMTVSYVVPSPLPLAVQQPIVAVSTGHMGNGGYAYGHGYGYGHLPVGRRHHRRCHSERPRAWREPSASLWTLMEE